MESRGFRYDSSVFPASWRTDYGWRGAQKQINRLGRRLVEVPVTPGFGGGYFRLFPYALSRYIALRANRRGVPAVFYIHPWEVDPGQPRIDLPRLKRLRHYVGLERTMSRLERLLSDFSFGAIGDVLNENGF
jgi:hypothetical protein